VRSEIALISPLVDWLMNLIAMSHCVCGEEQLVELALREALSNASSTAIAWKLASWFMFIAVANSVGKSSLSFRIREEDSILIRYPKPEVTIRPSLSVSLMDLLMRRIRINGSQQNGPEYLYEALDFVAQGKVKTLVEAYPLADAPKAYQRVADGKARFRAVLTM
jgi:D-arabinose 1-dehydrogenase-like Zn-dependent alcohol dehydrogenase